MKLASVGSNQKNTRAVYSSHHEGQVFFLIYRIGILILEQPWVATVTPQIQMACPGKNLDHSGRSDCERRLIEFLIEFEAREFDRPLGEEGSIHSINRKLDGVDVRQSQVAFRLE